MKIIVESILGDPMIILISGSLPIENHCRLHQWEENKTWILREDVPIYLRTMILFNQIQYIFCCLERKNLLSVWITAWNLVTSTHFTMHAHHTTLVSWMELGPYLNPNPNLKHIINTCAIWQRSNGTKLSLEPKI